MSWFIVFSAFSLAATYGLLAIGISLTWASLGMLNLAQGFTFAVSGYGAWTMSGVTTHPVAVMGAGLAAGATCGVVVSLLAFVPLHDRPNFQVRSLVVTLAISLIGTQLLQQHYGPQVKPLPKLFGDGKLELSGAVLTSDKTGAIVVATVVLATLVIWMRISRRGVQLRAMMQDPQGAALVGVSIRTTAVMVMAGTGALAGLASVLLAQTYFVSPQSGAQPLTKGLVIALLGGLGSISGAVIAAIMVGFTEALTADHLGGQYVLITQFALVIVVLLFRPRGIGGLFDEISE
ncbi:MAG: branched-chain amino acid ABC transporter permease [Actinomycetota bacterium]|jgi:branched-chain amino acid transport system permease protein|nr:MAG: inner-membrane translocator [Acidimicrobiaceae bacterium]